MCYDLSNMEEIKQDETTKKKILKKQENNEKESF